MQMNNSDPWGRPNRDTEKGGAPRPPELPKKTKEIIPDILGIVEKILSGGKKGGGRSKRQGFKFVLGSVLIILAIIWGLMGFYVVDAQERGVVLRFGEYRTILDPGLRWQPYFVDKVIVINVTRLRSFSARGTMLTKDENIADVTVEVQYIIQDVRDFVLKVRDPELSLRQATDSALRHVVGSTSMDQVITEGRAQVASEVTERLQSYSDTYETGIRVSRVNIQNADPPVEVKPAFEDVISAREDLVRFENQATAYANAIVPQARGEARRIEEDGRAYKESKISRSKGDAERFLLLHTEYIKSPQVTKKRLYLEAMQEVLANSNKILVDVGEGNNNLLYLPLDKLITQGRAADVPTLSPNNLRNNPAPLSETEVSRIVSRVLQEVNNRIRRQQNER